MKKKILAFGLAMVMALAAVGCGSATTQVPELEANDQDVTKTTKSVNLTYDSEDMAEVAENDSFVLSVKKDGSEIRVLDKTTNKVWSSVGHGKDFNIEDVNGTWQKKLQSPFELFYTDLKNGYGAIINLSLLEMEYKATIAGIDNGVRVTYEMQNPAGITIAMDYYLLDDGLKVDVPADCIKEEGQYSITSLKVLPYFLAASDKSDGYYFYPDGSGAIMEFKDSSHYTEAELALTTYGDIMHYKNMLDVLDITDPEIMLPVFGADIDNSGVLAIIEKGEEAARIKITPTTAVIGVNAIYCDFTYRRSFTDERISNSDAATTGGVSLTYDQDMIPGDRSISFRLLEKGKSTYSDMAVKYREYLENELGVETKVEKGSIPLSLDLFMGIKEDGLLYDEFKVVTTFEQSVEILQQLEENGVDNVDLQIKGWTNKGYFMDPVAFPVNSAVGGKNGLKQLTDYANDKNVDVSLEVNFMDAKSAAGGFNERDDVIYLGNKTIYANYNETEFLLSPTASLRLARKAINDGKNSNISGLSYYSLGQYLPYNYYTNDSVTQEQAVADYRQIFRETKDAFGKVTVQGGNSYVLGVADKVTDIPSSDSGNQITTKGVPFYQIAVHGLVEMSGLAGNLSSDIKQESLKWAEYGYMPYFELTHDGSEPLMYTEYSNLFSSTYTDWLDDAISIYTEFNKKLASVWDAKIVKHEEIQDDVFAVTYDNGKTVYVNYTDDEVSVEDDIVIDPTSFEVK